MVSLLPRYSKFRPYVSSPTTLTVLATAFALLCAVPVRAEKAEDEEKAPPPVRVSGHAMFRYTWKFDPETPNSAEIYNLRLYLDRSFEGITFHAEPRFRQTPLRSFSPSNVWIQQAWLAFDEYADRIGTLRAGLIYTRQGLAWDHSWFGNLVYLNGQKLDPDYGIEFEGEPALDIGGDATLSFLYGFQYLPVEDGLNGFFATERKKERLGATIDDGVPLDFDSAPGHTERNTVVGEFGPKLQVGAFDVRLGASVATSELERAATDQRAAAEGRETVYGAEVELGWRRFEVYGETMHERVAGFTGDGVGAARTRYLLGGGRWSWERKATWLRGLELRGNVSRVYYEYRDAEEWFAAPGLHLRIHELAGFTAEYVRWQFDDRRVVDRIEWIVHGYF